MLDIKLDMLGTTTMHERPAPHALNKINTLCNKSIGKFKDFQESYNSKQTNELNAGIDTDELIPIFFTYFHIGRLYYKIITPDKQMQLVNIANSLKYYKLFVDGCEKNEPVANRMKGELGVCKEMANLLPLKIKRLTEEIESS